MRTLFRYIVSWLSVPKTLGSFSRLLHAELLKLEHQIESLRSLIRLANPPRRQAFVWGTGAQANEGRVRKVQVNVGTAWLEPGETQPIYFSPYFEIREIELEVNEPFLISDVRIGNQSQAATIGPARKWKLADIANPAHRVTVVVTWPSDPGASPQRNFGS